jgi:methyl-accepting chemotaxis protein
MLGFSVLILLMAVLGAAAWYGLNTVEAQLSEVQTNLMPSVATAKTMQAEIRAFNLAQYRALTANDAQRMQDARTRLTASLGRYTSAADQYRPLIHTSEERAAYDELQALLPKYLAVSQQMLAALEQGRQEQAVDIMKDQLPSLRAAMEVQIQRLITVNEKGVAEAANNARRLCQQPHADHRPDPGVGADRPADRAADQPPPHAPAGWRAGRSDVAVGPDRRRQPDRATATAQG